MCEVLVGEAILESHIARGSTRVYAYKEWSPSLQCVEAFSSIAMCFGEEKKTMRVMGLEADNIYIDRMGSL